MSRLAVLPQYLLPKLLLTRCMGAFASAQLGWLTQAFMRWFVRRYQVNMTEAANADLAGYATFNDFFTRPLKAGTRPLAQASLVSPVDGAVSQLGALTGDAGDIIFQAKGQHYSLLSLLGANAHALQWAKPLAHGQFATLYLSPKDYHRIHMPLAGKLLSMVHVPGDLFSVNPTTARGVPGLFARNERVVCVFDSLDPAIAGSFVLVLVGATIVGSMATVWHGVVNPPRPGHIRHWDYADQHIELAQGAEMGRFLLGSTVVAIFPPNTVQFHPSWSEGRSIRMGEAMGHHIEQTSH